MVERSNNDTKPSYFAIVKNILIYAVTFVVCSVVIYAAFGIIYMITK